MKRSMRFAVLSLFALAGCSLATDFDRFQVDDKKSGIDGGDDMPDGGGDGDGDINNGDGGLDGGPKVEGQIDVQLAEGALGTVTSEPGGISCAGDCSEVYPAGTEVVLTAHPDATAAFVGWGGACEGQTGLTCTLTAGEPLTATASFTADWFDVTISRLGGGMGAVTSTDGMVRCDGSADEVCVVRYARGSTLTLQAAPVGTGSSFSGWGGSCAGEGACPLDMTGDKIINAVFDAEGQFSLIVSKAGNGAGTVTSDDAMGQTPPSINCGAQCAAAYAASLNKAVMLSATPDGSSNFVRFEGDCVPQAIVDGQPAKCLATVSAVRRVSVFFSLKQHSLSVAWSGNGAGGVTAPADSGNLACTKPQACSTKADHGTMLKLEAKPAEGSSFKQWSLASCGTMPVCEFPLVNATVLVASFEIKQFSFAAAFVGAGSVLCTVDAQTGPCEDSYDFGTEVLINAVPAPGNQLESWQGECAGKPVEAPCSLAISKDTSVVAQFKKQTHVVTVGFGNTGGHGAVNGPNFSCNDQMGTCTLDVEHGDPLTLTAEAAAGSDFVAFTGACSGQTCSIVHVNEDISVTASFKLEGALTQTLVVNKVGKGTVTGSAAGTTAPIACGEQCVANYNTNQSVTLTGTPDDGYAAAVFSGDCVGTGTCTVGMNAAKNVTTTFAPKLYPLTASVTGPGNLSFVEQGGLNCTPAGGDCSENLPYDSKITVKATPGPHGLFSSWGGACAGVLGADCQVTIDELNAVSAAFMPKMYTLSVVLKGEGLSPGNLVNGNGIACGVSGDGCRVDLPALTQVNLATTLPPWANVSAVDGPCDQPGPTCGFKLVESATVTFVIEPRAALVFVTTDIFPADLNRGLFDPEGAALGDQICTTIAGTAAGLPGKWIAWLSDSKFGPLSRSKRLKPGTPVMLLNGNYAMQRGYEAVAFGAALDNPIVITEKGGSLKPPVFGGIIPVWTGTLRSGVPLPDDRDWCGNWSSSTGSIKYGIGDAFDNGKDGLSSKAWTHAEAYDDSNNPVPFAALPSSPCSNSARLYCFRDWSPLN